MKKIAVVLFNLGGPDSKDAIRPFLLNFFTDPNIIRVPMPMRWLIAQLIAFRRSRREAGESYGELGDKSPLLENSRAQAQALQTLLNADMAGKQNYKCFICMRYWHPMAPAVVEEIKNWGADEIVLLPLYPQYSTTTTRSSYQVWQKASKAANLDLPVKTVCCYPMQNGFVQASAALVKNIYEKAALETGLTPRVLFSAHGLPESVIRDGDPYQWQCERTAEEIAKATGLNSLDWQICYQSRVGPQKWLGPSTEDALERAAHDGVPVVILPHAFTQEHVETLVEIELEYREIAEHLGVPGFYRVPTVGVHPDFIRGLADMVFSCTNAAVIAPDTGVRLCPSSFSRCAMQDLQIENQKSCGGCGCGHNFKASA